MSNSALVKYTQLSPNYSKRTAPITKIIVHHVAGVVKDLAALGNNFANPARQASSNYGIDVYGNVGMFVEEKNRSWASSSSVYDNMAVTIEVSNSSTGGDWTVSEASFETLVALCADICKRNNINGIVYTGNLDGNLLMHQWLAPTACPGNYLASQFPRLAQRVNTLLKPVVQEKEPEDTVSSWAKDAWDWAATMKLMDGTSPKAPVTREMLATALYRFAKLTADDGK